MRIQAIVRIFAILAAGAIAGCADFSALERVGEDAARAADRLRAQADALEARAIELPPDDPARADAELAIASARVLASAADQAATGADRLLVEASEPSHPISQAVGVVAPFIPEPYRVPILLAGAGVAAAIRAARLRRGLDSVVASIDKVRKDDPAFAEGIRRHADTIRSIQTPLARRVVDQVLARRARPIGVGG